MSTWEACGSTGPVTATNVVDSRLVTKVSNMATYNAAVIWLCMAVFFGALILIVNFLSRLRKGKKKSKENIFYFSFIF